MTPGAVDLWAAVPPAHISTAPTMTTTTSTTRREKGGGCSR